MDWLIWIDLLNLFSSKLYRKNNTAVECQRFLPQIIHCIYPYDLSLVTKWTKDYPGSPVKPSMSERGPAEWDGHWVGESHRKTKLTFQRTGTLSVLFFPHEIFFLVHFNTKRYMYMYYIFAAIKKVSPYDKSYSSYM